MPQSLTAALRNRYAKNGASGRPRLAYSRDMETAAVIIVGATAAVLAAVGYAAAWAAQRWLQLRYPAYWFAIGGAIIGALGSSAVVGGWATALFGTSDRVAINEVLPYMGAIKTHDERLYERIETSIIRDQQDGKSAQEVRINAKALVSSYVADKIPFLPDDLTYELYATTRDILAYLKEHDDHTACADIALGRFKGDLDTKLNPELIERNDTTTLRVIAAKPNSNATKMPAEQFTQLATDAFAEASQINGVAPEDVEKLLAGEGDPVKTCKLMKSFIDVILTQPVEVAAAALRTLASGGPRPNG